MRASSRLVLPRDRAGPQAGARQVLVVTGQASARPDRRGPRRRREPGRRTPSSPPGTPTRPAHPGRLPRVREPWASGARSWSASPCWRPRRARHPRVDPLRVGDQRRVGRRARSPLLCLYDHADDPRPRAATTRRRPIPCCLDAGRRAASPAFVPPGRFALNGDRPPLPAPHRPLLATGFTASRPDPGQAHGRRTTRAGRGSTATRRLPGAERLGDRGQRVEHGAGPRPGHVWTTGGELVCEIGRPRRRGSTTPYPATYHQSPNPRGDTGLDQPSALRPGGDARPDEGLRVRLHMSAVTTRRT